VGVTTKERVPAVDGWFTTDEPYTLIGAKCGACGTYVFPPRSGACPNPECDGTDLEPTPLSRRGKVWSYTENHYAPPAPYVAAEPFEPPSPRWSSRPRASSSSVRSPRA